MRDVSALVGAEGSVHELDGRSGARLLRGEPELVAYAAAFAAMTLPCARFFVRSRELGWIWATLEPWHGGLPARTQVSLRCEPPPYGLTARELEVLTLISGGLANPEIASVLVTTVRTIATHVAHLLQKLSTPTRAAAAALAVEHGWLRLPLPGPCLPSSPLGRLGIGGLAAKVDPGASSVPPVLDRARQAPRRTVRPLLIGSAFPLRGPAAGDGEAMRNGSALAVMEINARGGVRGKPIEQIVVETDLTDPLSLQNAIDALAGADVDAITTGYWFGDTPAFQLAVDYGAPYLHAQTAESSLVPVRDNPNEFGRVFSVCPSEIYYGSGFIRFLDQLVASGVWHPQTRELVFVETPVSGGRVTNDEAEGRAESSGWEIGSVLSVPPVAAVWEDVVTELHRRQPAAVLISSFLSEELAAFQRAFAARPLETLIYAIYTPSVPDFIERAGASCEGLIWATMSGTYGDAAGQRFADRYARMFSRSPGRSHAGMAYDEINMLARAWAAVDNPSDYKGVAKQLRTSPYRGVNGSYFLDNDGQCGQAYPDMVRDPSLGLAHLVLQIIDGRHRVLSPEPYVEAAFQEPPWLRRS